MKKIWHASIHILASELLSTNLFLPLVGWFVRRLFGNRLNTVILFYPANTRYMESVTFSWYARRVQWRPCFGGVFLHKDGGGLIFAMGSYEREFGESQNAPHLLRVHQRMLEISRLTGMKAVAYSGVLPSVFAKLGVDREPIEITRTAHWVVEAIDRVMKTTGMSREAAIIILGSAGFLGSKVLAKLHRRPGANIFQIDPGHADESMRGGTVLDQLRGQPAIVVNISRREVIDAYVEQLWNGVVVLNEVYPECSDETLARFKSKGVRYFHLQGVKAWSVPTFPGAYAGAIPCCAASATESSMATPLEQVDLLVLEK